MIQKTAPVIAALTPPLARQAPDFRPHLPALTSRSPAWLQGEVFAQLCPDGVALIDRNARRTYRELHENANRLAHALRAMGLQRGDALALICGNRVEFVEVLLAAMRLGLRLTPVNTHLGPSESAYIVRDCDAKLCVVEQSLAALAPDDVRQLRIGHAEYATLLAQGAPDNLADSGGGSVMLYTSGTTGRPKGVRRVKADFFEPQYQGTICDFRPGDVQLCAGPAYHAAPLLIDIRWPLVSGVPIVLLDKWDSEQVLSLIETHGVSCAHMVPTMLRRLHDLPPERRAAYDLHSLRLVVHGAAPCSVPLKQAMLDWWGPVLWEYYGATEGGEGINVSAQDWLKRPGTVGRLHPELGHCIRDDEGRVLAPRQVGRVWLNSQRATSFSYHKDDEKTSQAFQFGGLLLGDMGYVDEDGWLFLTGRTAELIISGGVNIYPSEIDEVLRQHPTVADAACIGAPDPEWGEQVVALVVRAADAPLDDEVLRAQLQAHATQHLARYKCPRAFHFVAELPYTATGKLLRSQLRAPFWAGHDRQI